MRILLEVFPVKPMRTSPEASLSATRWTKPQWTCSTSWRKHWVGVLCWARPFLYVIYVAALLPKIIRNILYYRSSDRNNTILDENILECVVKLLFGVFVFEIVRPALRKKKPWPKSVWWKHMPTPSRMQSRSDTDKHTLLNQIIYLFIYF